MTVEKAREEELRIHALGSAISRMEWSEVERAHAAIRDEFHARQRALAQQPRPEQEADPDRLLKEALFANLKAGRETAGDVSARKGHESLWSHAEGARRPRIPRPSEGRARCAGGDAVSVTTIPTIGFARGAVVRATDDGPNMLVVRGMGDRTVVIVIEADGGGNVRLRDLPTGMLHLVLKAQTPARSGEEVDRG